MMLSSIPSVFYNRYFAAYADLSKTAWFLLLLSLINAVTLAFTFFMSIYFSEIISLSLPQIGFLLSSYGVGMTVGGMVGGWLIDCYQPVSVACVSLLVQSVVLIALCYATDFPCLILLLFLFGLVAYSFKTANQYMMLNIDKNNSDLQFKIINLSHVASNLGLSISGVVIGLTSPSDFKYIFMFSGSLFLLFALLLNQQRKAFLQKRTVIVQSTGKTEYAVSSRRRTLFLLLLMVFAIGILIAQLGTTYPLYIVQQFPSLGQRGVSILFLLDTVLIVLCQAALLQATKQLNQFVIIGLGAFCMGIGMAALTIATTFYLAILFGIVWTIGEMLFVPSIQLQCFNYGASNKKGLSLGSFQSVFALSTILGPSLGSMIYVIDNGKTLWQISGLMGCVLCIICFYCYRRHRVR